LSHAIVWWSAFGADAEADVQRIESGLESAAGFARRRLAEALPLKRTPALRFRHDPSLALGARTLSILRSLSDDPDA
jgi:ribosome-binding factor A